MKKCSIASNTFINMAVARGRNFRPGYLQVRKVRAWLQRVPVLMMSATLTESMLDDLLDIMQLDTIEVKMVAKLPNRYTLDIK